MCEQTSSQMEKPEKRAYRLTSTMSGRFFGSLVIHLAMIELKLSGSSDMLYNCEI